VKKSRTKRRAANTKKPEPGNPGLPKSKRGGLPQPINGVTYLAESIAGKLSAESLQRLAAGRSATVVAALRDAVLEGISSADVHRTWLAEIDRIAHNTDDVADLRKAIAAYLRQAGIERVAEFSDETRFVVVPGGGSGTRRVIQPAYIDGISGRTILVGRVSCERAVDEEPDERPLATDADQHGAGSREQG
jgi:hypothetical protein